MTKIKQLLLLAVLMSMAGAKAFAHDIAVENADGVTIYYKWINNKTELEVSRGDWANSYDNEYSGNVVIPSSVTYNGHKYNVTSIGNDAFYECSGLTSVTIPSGVKGIGEYAFSRCSGLTSVTIPSGVKGIGKYAFSRCSGLTSVAIPSSVTSIGSGAFSGCSGLTSVSIPSSVTSIGSSAFYKCSSLTSVVIPSGVTSIGSYAFEDCSSLTSVFIPSSVTTIGYDAFSGCSSLSSVELHCTTIESWFRGMESIKEVVLGDGVTSIGSSAFSGCSGLTSVAIPSSVTSIGSGAFYNCSSLTSVTIPSSVTSIGSSAFYNCSSLTSVTILSKVTSIGSSAFFSCSSLSSVELHCTTIESWFRGMESIKEVVLGDGVTSIGSYAFYDCSSLTSVTISSSVTSIGGSAFSHCSSLTSVTISSGVTSIGSYAFRDCSSLTSVNISDLSAWCKIAFSSSDSNPLFYAHSLYLNGEEIKDLVIPSDVTTIGDYAFDGCSSLTSATIPSGVTTIGDYAFDGCSSLTSATIPSGVTSIGTCAFYGCSGLTSVTIPSGVTSIGRSAFRNCSSLTSVTIPSGVTSIGSFAFYNCSSLTSVTILSSVASISNDAFSGCSGLKTVELHCKRIGSWFNGLESIENVVIGDEVEDIVSGAFTGTNFYNANYDGAPYGVFYIGKWAFAYKGTINTGTEVTVKDGTVGLAGGALNYKNISSVNLPKSLKYVSAGVFSTSVGTITITSDTIVQAGQHSFTSSNRLFVPTGTKSAYQNAANWNRCTIYENTDVAQRDNAVYMAPADVRLGQQPVLEICLKNEEDATAYSFDVQFGGSVVIDEDMLSSRHTNHTRTFTDRGYGKYSFAVLSSSTDNLKGNDGAVRSVRLRFTSGTPANIPVTISNAVYSRPDGTSVKMDDVTTTVNVHDYARGDVNGDGEVDIADAVCVVKHVVGDNSVAYKERAADVNSDNGVDIADAVSIVNMIIGKKPAKVWVAAPAMREPQ